MSDLSQLNLSPVPARPELWEAVLKALRMAILSGEIEPGTRLVEAAIARKFDVSRLPVRQAIGRLEQEGLVIRSPGRGAHVVEFSASDVREIFDLRRMLEMHAVELATEHYSPEGEAQMIRCIEDLRDAVEAGDGLRAVRPDVAFHRTVLQVAGSQRLLGMWEVLVAPLNAMLTIGSYGLGPERLRLGPAAHEELMTLMRAGDRDGAVREIARQLVVPEVGLLDKLERAAVYHGARAGGNGSSSSNDAGDTIGPNGPR